MSWKDYVDDERALRRATERELMDTRAERDAAIAERDHLRERVTEADHALDAAIAERDRLRDRVKAVLEAVAKRVERMNPDTHIVDDAERYAHAELSEVAEALRLLLEVGS